VIGLGAAGVGGAIAVMKTGFDEAQESAKVMAQTEAVLKSTGQAANVTAKDVTGLAESLSHMSGVDDEAIQSGENLLLTFTRVRNEVGAGNDVFNQATRAALDMSVAMGTDLQSSALLVGKALNDPIKGMTALGRAGVQLTAEQKDLIKGFVETGDVMSAQKIILGELETQFGGSAKAFGDTLPGELAKAKNSFEEVSGQIVTQMLPAITRMLQGFSDFLVWLQVNWPRFRQTVEEVFNAVRNAGQQAVDYYRANIQPAVQSILAAIQGFWRIFGDTITNVTRTAFEAITNLIRAQLNIIKGVVELALAILRGDWSAAWNAIKSIVQNVWNSITAILRGAIGVAKTILGDVGEAAVAGLRAGIRALVDVARDKINDLLALIRELPGRIKGALGDLSRLLYSAGVSIIQGLIDGLRAKLGEVYALASSIAGAIKGLKGPISEDRKLLIPEGKAIIEGLQAGMMAQMRTALLPAVAGIGGQITAAAPAPRGGFGVPATGRTAAGWPERIVLEVDRRVLTELVREEVQRTASRNR
jgi:phage-related protein